MTTKRYDTIYVKGPGDWWLADVYRGRTELYDTLQELNDVVVMSAEAYKKLKKAAAKNKKP
jgi:hypothetical protein